MSTINLVSSDRANDHLGGLPLVKSEKRRAETGEVAGDDQQLEEIYQRNQSWPELIELLLQQTEQAEEARERAALLCRAAHLFETKLSDPERAFVTLTVALGEAPTDEPLADLERLAEGLGKNEELLKLAETVVAARDWAAGDDAIHGARLLARIARWSRRLGRLEHAAAASERALTLDPRNRDAMAEREESLRGLQRWGELARALSHRLRPAGVVTDSRAADVGDAGLTDVPLWLELAALWTDRLDDVEQAIDACHNVLRISPGHQVALSRLRRLAENHQRDELLVEVLKLSIAAAGSVEKRIEFQTCLAEQWRKLGRLDEACRTFAGLLAGDPGNENAYLRLADLYRQGARWKNLVETLAHHAAVVGDVARQAELLCAAGRIAWSELNDAVEARQQCLHALAVMPGHVDSLRLRAEIHRRQGDWPALAEALVDLAEHAGESEDRKAALLEAAEIQQQRCGDHARAAELYTRLERVHPEDSRATEWIFNQAFESGDLKRCLRLGEVLQRRPLADENAREVLRRMAAAALRLGDKERALTYFEQAGALGEDSVEFIHTWADLTVQFQRWPEAIELFRRLFERDDLSPERRTDCAIGLASAAAAHGDAEQAVHWWKLVLDAGPREMRALEGLIIGEKMRGDHRAAIVWSERLLNTTDDERRKIELARDIARTYADRLGDLERTGETLTRALLQMPGSRALLHDLLDLHSQTKNWPGAVAMLGQLADQTQGTLRAKYLAAAGRILKHELGDDEGAMERFNQALDANPSDLKIFEKLDAILHEKEDWKGQARNHRRMLKRLAGQTGNPVARAAAASLWNGLAHIYHSRLGDNEAATVTFEVVRELKAGDRETDRILAELYEEAGPASFGKAIEERRGLLARATSGQEMAHELRALQRMCGRAHDLERAYLATAGLVVLHEAHANDRRYYRQCTHHEYFAPQGVLSDDFWIRFLRHHDHDARLSSVFATVGHAVAALHARSARDLRQTGRLTIGASVSAVEEASRRLADHLFTVLSVPACGLVVRPENRADLELVPIRNGARIDLTLVLGAPTMETLSEKDLAFVLGRALGRTRPDSLVLWPAVVPSVSELWAITVACHEVGGGTLDASEAPAGSTLRQIIDGYVKHFRATLTAREIEALVALAGQGTPQERDLMRWMRGAVFSANRAAFLACNDLETAVRMVKTATFGSLTVERFEQVRDLLWWSVSAEYAAFRQRFATPQPAAVSG